MSIERDRPITVLQRSAMCLFTSFCPMKARFYTIVFPARISTLLTPKAPEGR